MPPNHPSDRSTPRIAPIGLGSGTWFGFKPIRTRRTSEAAVEQITDAIRAGELQVGDRLSSERLLADQMEISRPTLREAIKVLVDAGVLEVRRGPSGGMFVTSEIVPADLHSIRLPLRLSDVAGVLETRRLLEPRIAQLAALRATDHDFEAMTESIAAIRAEGGDRTRLHQLDSRFHLMMARASHNETVIELARLLRQRLDFALTLIRSLPPDPNRVADVHTRTLRAIMGGDATEIEAAIDEHLSVLEQAWEQETGRTRVRQIPDFLLPHDERADAR
ncbi:MAG: FCD domain-containing protein [Candidatus Dormiibacterota bacterium]